MAKKQFDTPVRIMGETGVMQSIATPFEAYTFLAGRKPKKIDLGETMIRKTCSAASMGILKPRVARAAFVRYAEKHGLLAPESDASAAQASQPVAAQVAV